MQVVHRSEYRFAEPVRLSTHTLRLRPADRSPAPVEHDLEVPHGVRAAWQRDALGEWTARIEVRGRRTSLVLASRFTTSVPTIDPLDPREPVEPGDRSPRARSGLEDPKVVPADRTGSAPEAFRTAAELAGSVQARLRHVEDHDQRVPTVEEVLDRGFASCRDSSMVLLHECAAAGLAARFVAGYLVRLAAHEDLVPGPWPRVVPASEDSVAYHAWVEVRVPELGWCGFDATTGRPAGGGHVPVASGQHPADTTPVAGATEPTAVTLTTTNEVRRA